MQAEDEDWMAMINNDSHQEKSPRLAYDISEMEKQIPSHRAEK